MLNEGEYTIKLGERQYTLRPTLNAMRALSRLAGGMRGVLEGLLRQDFDVVVAIIKHGANIPDRQQEAIADGVYKTGMNDPLLVPLVDYIRCLMNGGKPPVEMGVADDAPSEQSEGNA